MITPILIDDYTDGFKITIYVHFAIGEIKKQSVESITWMSSRAGGR